MEGMAVLTKRSHNPLLVQCCVRILLGLCTRVLLAEATKEFSLARYGVTFANNSVIDIQLVGEGFLTDSGALECHTDDTTCCRGIDNLNGGGRGEWYYPDGTVVPPPGGVGYGFYRTRGHMVIRMNRPLGPVPPTGIYTCVIPGAGGDTTTRDIQLEIRLINCDDLPGFFNGEVTYTPPSTVSPNLPQGKRYTGTIATYSCSSGYQLIGSSQRACGVDGTWNGTTTSCASDLIVTELPITLTDPLTPTEEITSEATVTTAHLITTIESSAHTDQLTTNDTNTTQLEAAGSSITGGAVAGGIGAAIVIALLLVVGIIVIVIFLRKETDHAELPDTRKPVSSSVHDPGQAYDVVDTPGLVEYEEIDKFRKTRLRDIELQDTPASSASQIPTYEVVDTPGSAEYEEIDKFKETRRNPVMIEQTHPPKEDYEYTQCPAYASTQPPQY